MRLELTARQRAALMPFLRQVRDAAACGTPGMLLAQVCWDAPLDNWWFEVGFLRYEHAKLITEKGQTA